MANLNLEAYSRKSNVGNPLNGDNYLYVHSIYQRFWSSFRNSSLEIDLTETVADIKKLLL
ncbi:hypothetical protein EOM09_06995 [bacterium]|nr:hypothetical protein [bacterium]